MARAPRDWSLKLNCSTKPIKRGRQQHQQSFRRRKTSRDFRMNTELENTLRSWLGTSPPVQPLRLQTEHIDVVVSWRDYVHPHGNTFSSMPSEAHDVRDNPLYTVLKSKQDQLRSAPSGTRRAIFLGDAGCHLLRDIRPMTQGLRTVSGYDIIQTFLSDTDIDFVAVFVPKYQNEYAIV